MNVRPITPSLPGEHLAATWPTMRVDSGDSRPHSYPGWRQRLRFWAGRALTADALTVEQENRAARLAWIGRTMTSGIVRGLEIALEPPPAALELRFLDVTDMSDLPDEGRMLALVALVGPTLQFRVFDSDGRIFIDASEANFEGRVDELNRLRARVGEFAGSSDSPSETERREIVTDLSAVLEHRLEFMGFFLHVLPGYGLGVFGDDVTVPRPMRVALDQIGVSGLPDGIMPWAAVVLLRPAEFRRFDNIDPNDPCELDPSYDAFADERRQDASLLELFALPDSIRTLPELNDPDVPSWRNRLAYALFQLEAEGSARQILRQQDRSHGHSWDTILLEAAIQQWEFRGLPLGLLSSELLPGEERRQLFLDRAVVARRGGLSRSRSRPIVALVTEGSVPEGTGTPGLWRARVDQFAEQLGALQESTSIVELEQRFRFVPPAGLLPRPALRLLTTDEAQAIASRDRAAVSSFFPATFSVEAAPIPTEELDAALATSAPLAPIDIGSPVNERVRILVPVPQRVFDSDLLVVEEEDPFFAREIGRLVALRQDWRQRSDYVRSHRDTLQAKLLGSAAASGSKPFDSDQVEPEPVEVATDLGFGGALLSPQETRPPWELDVNFEAVRPVSAATRLFVQVHLDLERLPGPIEIRWKRGSEEFLSRFELPPTYPLERFDEHGKPLPSPLWLLFSTTAGDIGLNEGDVTGFSLTFSEGRIAISRAGALQADGIVDSWWDPAANVNDWSLIPVADPSVDPADPPPAADQLLAPFEVLPRPVFENGTTLRQRLDELDAALEPADAIARTPAMSVSTHGIERVLAELDAEANEADDFVDANFVRAQTNLYRVRKLILGETAAQKLLINPAIATIAEQETANATAEQLNAYIDAARKGGRFTANEVNQALSGVKTRSRSLDSPLTFTRVGIPTPNPIIGISGKQVIEEGISPFVDKTKGISPKKSKQDIIGQRPETGTTLPPRGLSIGQRFEEPKATENLSFARAALAAVVNHLQNLRLPLIGKMGESVEVPVIDYTAHDASAKATVRLLDLQGRSKGRNGKTTDQLRDEAVESLFRVTALSETTEAGEQVTVDEAEVTLAALDLTETHSGILRAVEGVVLERRGLIERGRETLFAVNSALQQTEARLTALAPSLAEARHDVSVARALQQEERELVNEINERRDAIIREEVRFLAYARPRAFDPVRRTVPGWRVFRADVPAPIPACLAQHDEPPDALRAYVQLFRHAPVRWFTAILPKLRKLNTKEKQNGLLGTTRQTALQFVGTRELAFLQAGQPAAIVSSIQSGFSIIEASRLKAANAAPSFGRAVTWEEQRRMAEEYAALGDVIDGRHGQADLSRAAADLLERIEEVATCLHAEFAGVAPAVRLAWVERYSQFDRPSPLDNLTALPNYGSLPRETRRRFQEFADWLFGQIDRRELDAFNLINDLVRICLLLASHAPVKKLITGHVPKPTAVKPGSLVFVKPVSPPQVRVGMEVQVWQAATNTIVARGLVEDLKDGEVSARMEKVFTSTATTTVDQTMQVQFVPPAFKVLI